MKLTENVILTRSKQSKLHAVKELNLCGFGLSDVSAIAKLTNVEVLALSVNNITQLSPFASCLHLRELYLRRNEIDNINQLYYLQRLPRLTNLWLIENPFCAQLGYNYRTAVLSILPRIKVLDNVAVGHEELELAKGVSPHLDALMCIGCQVPEAIPMPPPQPTEKESNVLSAIHTLVKDLDLKGLEALHQSIEQRIRQVYSERQ